MKKYLWTILITSGVMLVLLIGGFIGLSILGNGQNEEEKIKAEELDIISEDGKKEKIELSEVVPLLFEEGKETDSIMEPQYIEKYPAKKIADIYQVGRSKEIKKSIDKKVRKGGYTVDKPLWIWNPFGTNELSMYVAFQTPDPVKIRYTISVEDNSIPDFTRTLKNNGEGNLASQHNYQITGFVPGIKNYLVLKIYNERNKEIARNVFSIEVSELASGERQRISVSQGKSKTQLTNGLFCAMGREYIRWYDNSGFIRGEIPTMAVNSQKIEFVDGTMVYAYKKNGIAVVGTNGQVIKTIDTGKYQLDSDFIYNGYGQIWAVATNTAGNTVRDNLLSIDLEKETVNLCLDFKKVLPDVYKQAKKPKKEKKLDWISIQSLNQQGSDSILISCNELSSLIKINNISSKIPSIAYIIGDKNIWNQKGNRTYKNYLYAKNGQDEADANAEQQQAESVLKTTVKQEVFQSAFDIYDITTEKGVSLEDGQYYVYFLNNNYGSWETRKDFSWKKFSEIGKKESTAKNSFYYKYLIDEKAGTYDLIEEKKIAYSNEASNVKENKGNKIIYQSGLKSYHEDDKDGRKIKEFTLTEKAYRVNKFDMKGFWFQ